MAEAHGKHEDTADARVIEAHMSHLRELFAKHEDAVAKQITGLTENVHALSSVFRGSDDSPTQGLIYDIHVIRSTVSTLSTQLTQLIAQAEEHHDRLDEHEAKLMLLLPQVDDHEDRLTELEAKHKAWEQKKLEEAEAAKKKAKEVEEAASTQKWKVVSQVTEAMKPFLPYLIGALGAAAVGFLARFGVHVPTKPGG